MVNQPRIVREHIPEQGGIRAHTAIEHPEAFGFVRLEEAAQHVRLARLCKWQLDCDAQVFPGSRQQFLDLGFRRRPGMLYQANGLGVLTRYFFRQIIGPLRQHLNLFVPRDLLYSRLAFRP